MIKLNEIFLSIQGESSYAGWPTVFIRTSGCNLRCTYCDTTYAYYEGEKSSVEKIIATVQSHPAKHVCVTGGEPMAQPETVMLLKELCDLGYKVSLETSGSISCAEVDRRVKKIIDVKTPDSGAAESFLSQNLDFATDHDEFKFVICSENDFAWSEQFVARHRLAEKFMVLYSPSFGKIEEKWLAKKILSESSKARLQLQLHKYIWSPDTRGV
ncbi:MAG: radical SAM protein [Bdellovibrionia bacterium]